MAGPHDNKLEPIEVPDRLHMIGDRFLRWPKSEVDVSTNEINNVHKICSHNFWPPRHWFDD